MINFCRRPVKTLKRLLGLFGKRAATGRGESLSPFRNASNVTATADSKDHCLSRSEESHFAGGLVMNSADDSAL
jgi:hypothetical protein